MVGNISPEFQKQIAEIVEAELKKRVTRPDGAEGDIRVPDLDRVEGIVKEALRHVISRPDGADGEPRVPDLDRVNGLIDSALRELVVREDASEEKTKVPDEIRSKKIAVEAIEEWAENRPPWWNVRKRLESALVGGGLAAVIVIALFETGISNTSYLRDTFHVAVGTGGHVEGQINDVFRRWSEDPKGDKQRVLHTAFETRLAGWAEGDAFKQKTGGVLEELATEETPKFSDLIRKTLRSQPVLMFQSEATFGAEMPIDVNNEGCGLLIDHWIKAAPANLPSEFRPVSQDPDPDAPRQPSDFHAFAKAAGVCRVNGSLKWSQSMSVPFWAGFHKNERGVKDEVWLILKVQRDWSEQEKLKQGDKPLAHPYANALTGLKVEYSPSGHRLLNSGGDSFDLVKTMQSRAGGFFYAQIDPIVAEQLPAPAAGDHSIFDLLHNITVAPPAFPEEFDILDQEKFCRKDEEEQTKEPVCLDETILVQALIIVNNSPTRGN